MLPKCLFQDRHLLPQFSNPRLARRSFELLLSSPVSSAQIVLGKYLGVVGFLSVLFGLTLYQVGVLYWLGSPDPGIVAASYGAMLALALVFGAVGMFASSLTDIQLVAFMISFAALLMLFILGALKSRFTAYSWWRSGLEVLVVGGSCAACAYLIGWLVERAMASSGLAHLGSGESGHVGIANSTGVSS